MDAKASISYSTCSPADGPSEIVFSELAAAYDFIVVANYFVGCNAGRRESGVYAYTSQRLHDEHRNVVFISTVKGGGTGACASWSKTYADFAESTFDYPITSMPITVADTDYSLRDTLFTSPFPHPSYIILDSSLTVRDKFVGPCCGFESYTACSIETASTLDATITDAISDLLTTVAPVAPVTESPTASPTTSPTKSPTTSAPTPVLATPAPTASPTNSAAPTTSSPTTSWSPFSPCSVTCGVGTAFRFKLDDDDDAIESTPCTGPLATCPVCALPSPPTFATVATNLNKPMDVAFHPAPGTHLTSFSESRSFPTTGLEAWVANAGNHSLSIIPGITTSQTTTISRRDRGYYHYNTNVHALSFNAVSTAQRAADKDTFGYFATCQNNPNNYLGSKEANFFMGPSLYDSRPGNRNLVNLTGDQCGDSEQCYFLHSDMLHEAPNCVGIVHDPETHTSYGSVFFQIDGWNNQIVRFDFQQPHGPGSMQHAVAAVRRYPEVPIEPSLQHHAGMAIDPTSHLMYVANFNGGSVFVMDTKSGENARTARQEYPIFSSRLPSFEYSIYECVDHKVFVEVDKPTGVAVSDGKLFVASNGREIRVYSLETVSLLFVVETEYENIQGLTMGQDGRLYFVDSVKNELVAVELDSVACDVDNRNADWTEFVAANELTLRGGTVFEREACVVDSVLPDDSLFEQVHSDSGYASHNETMAAMTEAALLLKNRTDCEVDGDLNFDALLLGGYFCHTCLPNPCEGVGLACVNLQWEGAHCVEEEGGGTNNELSDGEEVAISGDFGGSAASAVCSAWLLVAASLLSLGSSF